MIDLSSPDSLAIMIYNTNHLENTFSCWIRVGPTVSKNTHYGCYRNGIKPNNMGCNCNLFRLFYLQVNLRQLN